jgi:Poly A polymerase head domain/Probable RNA and SrmB- binding site of polymerase A
MLNLAREILAGEEAWVVGGAVRDELLGRPLVDLDIACRDPEEAARRYARLSEGAPFPLSERHGAWRVALPEDRTVDFTPLPEGILADLATRDFTINAVARPLAGGDPVDPFGGVGDLDRKVLRAVGPGIFHEDPLRLLRAVRLEDELGFQLDPETEGLVLANAGLITRSAGERILGELERLEPSGFERLDELGLLAPLGGSPERLRRLGEAGPEMRLVAVFGEGLGRLPVPNELRRYASALLRAELPPDASPRAIHRFRRATEPWATDAARFAGGDDALEHAIEEARANEPAEPLLRGDELGLPPGPEIGQWLERIAEERAAGTISTRDDALALVRSGTVPGWPSGGPDS